MSDDLERLRSWLTEAGLHCGQAPILTGKVRFEKPIRVFNGVELVDCDIGAYSYISAHTRVARTTIGRYSSIGGGVRIGLSKHPIGRLTSSPVTYKNIFDNRVLAASKPFVEFAPITIGHDVWVGERSIVMDGVTIGSGAIVAAGSVVTRDVEPYSIVAGVPARLLRPRFSTEIIDTLLAFRWWQYDLFSLSEQDMISDWDDPILCIREIERAIAAQKIESMLPGTVSLSRNGAQYALERSETPLFA